MNKIIRIGKSEYHRNEIPEQKQTESRIQSLPWKLKDLYPNEDIKMERFHNKQLETRFLDNHKNLKKKLRKLILYPEKALYKPASAFQMSKAGFFIFYRDTD